jgi:hypothetical protein
MVIVAPWYILIRYEMWLAKSRYISSLMAYWTMNGLRPEKKLQVGGLILARGILGIAAEWFAGVAAKGMDGVLYLGLHRPPSKTPSCCSPRQG